MELKAGGRVIYVVIPVHNRVDFTLQCLTSLRAQTVRDFRTIVVDDGSTDGTREVLNERFPEVTILTGDGNLFWTAAVNMGIRYALTAPPQADHVLVMNNDGYLADNFLEKMMYWSHRHPDALLCAFEIDAVTRRPYYGGEIVNPTWQTSRKLLAMLPADKQKGLHETSVAPGRGLFIPRKVFDTIGLFSAKWLPHYMADFDFACLARRHGFPVYCNYDARLYTYSEESGDKKILRKKSFRNYMRHLFDIKGAGNLRNFTVYTFRNSPPALIPLHLVKGYSSRILRYFFYS